VGKPGQELFDRETGPEFLDSGAKVLLGVQSEMAQLPFEIRPPQFDGVQVRAVGRQIDGDGAGGLNGLAYALHLVRAQVVEADDVAFPQPGNEPSAYEVQEDLAVHRSSVSHEPWPFADAHRPDERHRPPLSEGPRALGTTASTCPSEVPAHSGRAVGLVEEDESFQLEERQQCTEDPATSEVLRSGPLDRREGLFFREYPCRCNARSTDERLVFSPVCPRSAAVSSATVASGIPLRMEPRSRAIGPRIGEKWAPRCGRRFTVPVSRYRRSTRLTVASPIPRTAAICTYVRCSL
jgi:hypothetical protein